MRRMVQAWLDRIFDGRKTDLARVRAGARRAKAGAQQVRTVADQMAASAATISAVAAMLQNPKD